MDVWSIFIFIILAQGIFSVIVLASQNKLERNSQSTLIILILVLLWIQAEFLAIRNAYDVGIDIFYGTRFGSWLIIGPLVLFYIQKITAARCKLHPKDYVHLIPFFILVVGIPLFSSQELTFRQVHYGMLTVFDYRGDAETVYQWFYSAVFMVQFVHLAGYLFWSYLLFKGYETNLKKEYSDIGVENLAWIKIFLISFVLILVGASLFIYMLFYTEIYRRHYDYIYVIPVSFLIYLVSFKLAGVKWKSPSIEMDVNSTDEDEHSNGANQKYKYSSLTEKKASEYIEKLNICMTNEKPYLNNDLKLQHLSEAIDIPVHQLSEILNQYMETSFFDFINEKRIEEAKHQIRIGQKGTLLQIAFDSGFNNKTSFINAFKKFEGMTPSQYQKKKKVQKNGQS